jgi:septum formation inhibitor MinC
MLISDKQHEANCQNAQQSSGPKTPEGKAAVRLNALTHGLRARSTLISTEKPEEYDQLWNGLLADFHPQNRTELLYLETACTSQWLLARVAKSEKRIYEDLQIEFDEKYFRLLAIVAKQRAQLERSFRTAIQDLKQAQKERQSQPKAQPLEAAPKPAESPAAQSPPVHPPTYVMAEPDEAHPVFCAPINPDTR